MQPNEIIDEMGIRWIFNPNTGFFEHENYQSNDETFSDEKSEKLNA